MRKLWFGIAAVAAFSILLSVPAAAGQWRQDSHGWWYSHDNGSYPSGCWEKINGCYYYFDDNGYMLSNTTTPDGYHVNTDGAWDGCAPTSGTVLTGTNAEKAAELKKVLAQNAEYSPTLNAGENSSVIDRGNCYEIVNTTLKVSRPQDSSWVKSLSVGSVVKIDGKTFRVSHIKYGTIYLMRDGYDEMYIDLSDDGNYYLHLTDDDLLVSENVYLGSVFVSHDCKILSINGNRINTEYYFSKDRQPANDIFTDGEWGSKYGGFYFVGQITTDESGIITSMQEEYRP